MKAPFYVGLLHYPVYKKDGDVITTSITPIDIHDIARSCYTYGALGYYVVNALPTMQHLACKVTGFWQSDYGLAYNKTRTDALSIVRIKAHLEDCIAEIKEKHGQKPLLVLTSAKRLVPTVGYDDIRQLMENSERPILLLFGTGYGLIREFARRCDYVLEPIEGPTEYNHLSVRSAAAIILDRLCRK